MGLLGVGWKMEAGTGEGGRWRNLCGRFGCANFYRVSGDYFDVGALEHARVTGSVLPALLLPLWEGRGGYYGHGWGRRRVKKQGGIYAMILLRFS